MASLTVILGGGCSGDSGALGSETDDSAYREGQQLERQGRADEALAAYLKVIARRGDAAPESHLDAGILYLNHIKDPITAIYHFRKYLELMPNSRQAANVRGEIAAATREFARTLPGQPLDSQATRLGLGDEIESLRRENEELRAELAALHDGVAAAPAAHLAAAGAPAGAPSAGLIALPQPGEAAAGAPVATAVMEEPAGGGAPAVALPGPASGSAAASASAPGLTAPPGWTRVGGAAAASPSAAGAGPARTSAATGAASTRPAGPAAGRHHTVVRGDTLSGLAQKYYGSRSKWREILAANHDLLSGPNDLKIGMELRVP